MKKSLCAVFILLCVTTTSFGQKPAFDKKVKEQIIALEKSGWEAWKNKTVAWFEKNTSSDFLTISADGISDKAQVIKSTPVDCDVKTYSLSDFTFVMLTKDVVYVTYIATQDASCGGVQLPAKVRAAVTYVKRENKWKEAMYIDTPLK